MPTAAELPATDPAAGIPGWFGFAPWYDEVARTAPPGATLVELGVFCGKSLAYLAKAARGKGCRVVGVDTFLGSPEFSWGVRAATGERWEEFPEGQLAQLAVAHLKAAGVLDDVTLIVSDSAKAAGLFADGSVYAVFVDADHAAESVERDILAWWPKLVPGGWIAGDDYDETFPGVRQGITRAFPGIALPALPPAGQSSVWNVRKG